VKSRLCAVTKCHERSFNKPAAIYFWLPKRHGFYSAKAIAHLICFHHPSTAHLLQRPHTQFKLASATFGRSDAYGLSDVTHARACATHHNRFNDVLTAMNRFRLTIRYQETRRNVLLNACSCRHPVRRAQHSEPILTPRRTRYAFIAPLTLKMDACVNRHAGRRASAPRAPQGARPTGSQARCT
jgi:hypothetical protein